MTVTDLYTGIGVTTMGVPVSDMDAISPGLQPCCNSVMPTCNFSTLLDNFPLWPRFFPHCLSPITRRLHPLIFLAFTPIHPSFTPFHPSLIKITCGVRPMRDLRPARTTLFQSTHSLRSATGIAFNDDFCCQFQSTHS